MKSHREFLAKHLNYIGPKVRETWGGLSVGLSVGLPVSRSATRCAERSAEKAATRSVCLGGLPGEDSSRTGSTAGHPPGQAHRDERDAWN